jgi:hypothetical protein
LDPEPQNDAAPALAKVFGSISAADVLLYIGIYCFSVFGSLSPPAPVPFHNRDKKNIVVSDGALILIKKLEA